MPMRKIRQKYSKFAFTLHVYGYIKKVIINKPNGESLYTNEIRKLYSLILTDFNLNYLAQVYSSASLQL